MNRRAGKGGPGPDPARVGDVATPRFNRTMNAARGLILAVRHRQPPQAGERVGPGGVDPAPGGTRWPRSTVWDGALRGIQTQIRIGAIRRRRKP